MSESGEIELVFNQIEADPAKEFRDLVHRIPVDLYALRAEQSATGNDMQVAISGVVVHGAEDQSYDIISESAEQVVVEYRGAEEGALERLIFTEGTLWHTQDNVSNQVPETLDGIHRAAMVAHALQAALARNNTDAS